MTNFSWKLIEAASCTLDLRDREAALGDLLESNEPTFRALLGVTGLAFRRHALLWKQPQPWFAALALTFPGSFILMGFSLSTSQLAGRILTAHPHASVPADAPFLLLSRLLLLLCVAWTGGHAVGSLSRRTLWASAATCLLPCLFCLSRFHAVGQSRWNLLLFLAPALCGAWLGVRGTRPGLKSAIALAVVATVVAVPAWPASGASSVLTLCLLLWPSWFLAATASSRPIQN